MDNHERKNLIRSTTIAIVKQRRDVLTDVELKYITSQIGKLSLSFIKMYQSDNLAVQLAELFIKELAVIRAKPEPKEIDMHEILKNEIGNNPETTNSNLPNDMRAIDAFNSMNGNGNGNEANISTIFGTNLPLSIQRVFNPKALEYKAYVVLDRRYQSGEQMDNSQYFSWNVSPTVGITAGTGVLSTTAPVKDIVKIKMFPFTFPNTPNAITDTNRLTVAIQEFSSQAYSAENGNRSFHFEFKLVPNATNPNAPFSAEDIGQSTAEFEFYKPIEDITTLTISFGNPFLLLTLEPDRGVSTITSVGVQAQLTFTTPPFLATGDIIYISGFTTTNAANDSYIIALMNSIYGWPVVTVSSSTQVLIDVDLSTLSGAIVGTQKCYFDSKRFAPRLEFTFRRSTG